MPRLEPVLFASIASAAALGCSALLGDGFSGGEEGACAGDERCLATDAGVRSDAAAVSGEGDGGSDAGARPPPRCAETYDIGPIAATLAESVEGDGVAWTDPSRALLADTFPAQVTLAPTQSSQELLLLRFASNIDGVASVAGLKVSVRRYTTSGAARDKRVRLRSGLALQSVEKRSDSPWGVLPLVVEYGGPTDLWGFESLSLGPTFALDVSIAVTSDVGAVANVDDVKLTVTFCK